MTRFIRPLGYLVAGLLLVGAFGIYTVTKPDDNTYGVTAYFEKAIGVFPNADVTILGVAVGKITEVVPEGTRVRVEMEVDKDYKVPASAFAQIVPISLISDRYIQLAPVYESGPVLEDGAVLEVEDTQIPAELDDVFKQLKKLLEAIEPGQEGEPGALGELIVQLNDTLRDRELDLRGTLIHGADLTSTLADAQDDISGLLVNLEGLFGKLATRSGDFGTLNANLATVMTTLAESREDLEGTVVNLASLSREVGDLVRRNGDRLGGDLELAGRITETVLDNRASVEQALAWLGVVGKGVKQAYNPNPIDSIDVRDNASSARCDEVADLPDEIKDALEDVFDVLCGGPPQQQQRTIEEPGVAPKEINCDSGVKKVKRQLKKLGQVGIPDEVKEGIIKPLRKKLRQLNKECDLLGDKLKDPKDLLDDLLDDIGGIPDVDPNEFIDDLTGDLRAAGDGPVAVPESPAMFDTLSGWFGGFFSFLGGSR